MMRSPRSVPRVPRLSRRFCGAAGTAALWAALSWMLLASGAAYAGPGHGHDAPAVAAAPQAPQRLPDGSVFLPKPAQRLLAVRTTVAATSDAARTTELAGRVVMDPNAGGRVQPMQAGRLEAPGRGGLPVLGQAVRKGQVLAYVVASAAPLERASQQAQVAELQAAQALARQRLARLQTLSDTVARKDIEAAQAEVESLAARMGALSAGLSAREALTAPLDGVIAAAPAVLGQVVDARELVFEIVDPRRLAVEAMAFDPVVATDLASAVLATGTDPVALQFRGAARSLRDQALPLMFSAQGDALARLAVGQPVRVLVRSGTVVRGVALPVAAVVRSTGNQPQVWVKTAPERFEPRAVRTEPLDGARVLVVQGLQDGDRVVVQGAALVQQVR